MKKLIDNLKKENIYISVEEGNLKISYDDDIRADLLDQIKSNKEELIQYIALINNKQKPILKTTAEKVLISPTQTKLWLIDKMLGPGNLYNIPSIFKINGQIEFVDKIILPLKFYVVKLRFGSKPNFIYFAKNRELWM